MSELDLELLSRELQEGLKKATTKRLQSFDDACLKLKRGNKESVDAMRVIERSFIEEQKLEKQNFTTLQTQVSAIDNELKGGLDTYLASYNIEHEARKLEDSKEKGVMPKMMIYRKETHDANFKYDRILKEEKDTLREKNDNYLEFEKQSKAKVFDLEKRCRLEVNKEKSQTLASYDDLQKKLLDTNNRKEIKEINKNIQEMQKVGLKKEKEIKLNYQDLIKTEKLNYEENKKKILIDINGTTKDFALKKLEIEKEKKLINLRYQIELDKYDFGSKRAINNLNQKMLLKKNSIVLSYKENKKNLVEAAKATQIENINKKKTMTNDFLSVMDKNYDAFNETQKLGSKLIKDVYVEEYNKYSTYLNEIIKNVFNMLIDLNNEYFDKVVTSEYENMKLLLSAKYNYEALNKKSYEEFINKLDALYNSFKEDVVNASKKHEEEINSLIKEANDYINSLFERMKNSLKEENVTDKFYENLYKLLKEELDNTKKYESDAYEKELNDFPYINSHIKDYEDSVAQANQENKEITDEHKLKDEEIDKEVNAYYQVKDEEKAKIEADYQSDIASITNECSSKCALLEQECAKQSDIIKEEKIANCKQIEIDFTTAMSLLK